MPQAANIVLADAQATPVNHTFIPIGPDANGFRWFEDQSGSNAIGYNRIGIRLKRPAVSRQGQSSGDRVNRVEITIQTPVLETLGTADNGITPPPTVAYVPRANIEIVMNERSTAQQRKDLRKYAQFLLADAQIVAVIELLQSIY